MAVAKFKTGTVVKKTGKFLRSIGSVTAPVDGLVLGSSSTRLLVAWSDGLTYQIQAANVQKSRKQMEPASARATVTVERSRARQTMDTEMWSPTEIDEVVASYVRDDVEAASPKAKPARKKRSPARKKTDSERWSSRWEEFFPSGFTMAEVRKMLKDGLPKGTKLEEVFARSPIRGWEYGLTAKINYQGIGAMIVLNGAPGEASGNAMADHAGVVGLGRASTPQVALRRIISETKHHLVGRKPEKSTRKKATKKATRTMEQIRAGMRRMVDSAGGAEIYLTDLAARAEFRGVDFARLQKAAEQLKAKWQITFDGLRLSARLEGVELHEIKRLTGPFKVTSEGEENIYFTDGGGKPYYFKYDLDADRSEFFKTIQVRETRSPTAWPEDTAPTRKRAKKAAKKKTTKKVAKRKAPAKKKRAKRTRTHAEEARAKRLAKKNAAARRKKAAKKKSPRVQRSPAEEQRILNAWKRGAGAV